MKSSPTVVSERVVIEGGNLGRFNHWVPEEISVVGGANYLPLAARDRKLAAYCGGDLALAHPLAGTSVLRDLRKLRNDKVMELIHEEELKEDPMAAGAPATNRSGHLGLVDMDALPNEIILHMPAIEHDGESVAATDLYVLVDVDPKKVVRLKLESSSLEYVRMMVRSSLGQGETDTKRRKALERVTVNVRGVRWDYRRQSLYTWYTNPDGRRKQKYAKPDDMDQASIDACAQHLLDSLAAAASGEHAPTQEGPASLQRDMSHESEEESEDGQ